MSAPRYRWQPTTVEIARAYDIPIERVIRFDHNTSPFPSSWALAAMTPHANGLNEYPGADYRPIRVAAAEYTGTSPDRIMAGAGIDELILLAATAFLSPGSSAGTTVPNYPLYRIASAQRHAGLTEISRQPPLFAAVLEPLLEVASQTDLLWLCEPHNPSGSRLGIANVEALVEAAAGTVVIDAAYAEFVDDAWAPLIERHDNVVVLRTLSKAFGLAGARVGYAMAQESLIAALDAVRPPGSISSLSVAAAVEALSHPTRMRVAVEAIVAERTRFAARLTEMGFGVLPSATNFLLVEVGPDADHLAQRLLEEGLVVRSYPGATPLGQHLRFTVRFPEENDRLLSSMSRVAS